MTTIFYNTGIANLGLNKRHSGIISSSIFITRILLNYVNPSVEIQMMPLTYIIKNNS